MKNLFKYLGMFEELAVGGLLLLLAIGTTVQVFTRYFLDLTFDWFDEGARYLLIFATFLGASMAVKHGAHYSMEAVVQYVPVRIAACMRMLGSLCSTAVMLVIAWYGWSQTMMMARYGMTTAALGVPMWIPYLPIGLFSISIALRFLHQAWLQFRIVIGREVQA